MELSRDAELERPTASRVAVASLCPGRGDALPSRDRHRLRPEGASSTVTHAD